ncbi:lysine--tRNA ligase [Candidatus Viridilinea mediisalina]|uniref:Lysine--tRNA ligase n=1 Tax=Candidatus Viridilinea mediisalina TaxID=2024553 RepID=A0A2A6RDR7_9CHLR|nr:lysine--tRNA ligase [Candidatus Viridilinea mediisalina]PDW00507.1 lysine--tRNA ligase [Candidatus Viridilinea mediisalina]
MELNELQNQRAAKLERLRAADIEPYPTRAERTHTIAAALEHFEPLAAEATPLVLTGRIVGARRIMGKIAFAHIDDGSATLQLWLSRAELGEAWFQRFRDDLDTFDIVQVHGHLRRTKAGEASLFVTSMKLLTKAINPPPEKWAGLSDVEERHRQRYLDLIVNHEVREVFRARAAAITAMREVLDTQGFLEVETPVLQPLYGGAAARPFTTYHNTLGQNLYLRIATELYLKRLIVGGFPGVYEIGKNFRNEGVDRSHNPEFTMMECYQAYGDYTTMMRLVETLMRTMCQAVNGGHTATYQGQVLDFGPAWQCMPMAQAIAERTGIDLVAASDLTALQQAIASAGLHVERKPTWGKQVDELFSAYVQPHLVQPTFITEYPVELSPLAKRIPERPAFTERFEAFAVGMEIGNAFTELNDPFDQEQRFLEQGRDFAAGDEEAHQMDVDFLNALMYGMPPTGGLGMGIDRILMVLTDRPNIREVILFPHMRQREG